MKDEHAEPLEVWAGFECTLNRVGDTQYDQLARSGHYGRPSDIDRVAALGVRTVRYPVLWERVEAACAGDGPWEWVDEHMERMRLLGIDPIVGLMHHGSGPMDTNLLDDGFPERLAAHALRVARRYPWVTRFTPVNEPLTTARFSALYGFWHPHARADRLFIRAMLNEIRATRLAMECIRRVTPSAELIQTEDLGHTHSTPALRYQAAFENERRWFTFDLLTGRLSPSDAMWDYARWAGVSDDEILRAIGDTCAPAVLGINHYVTSERWLDKRLYRYPPASHGGNGRVRYADVEAVRAKPAALVGPATLLRKAWDRYRIPVAITEAHIGCTREQQMRWLYEMWNAARSARAAGVDVRAVTAWAALGAYDWNSLVTRETGVYEPGLFDLRAPEPRPTGLATVVQDLVTKGECAHPALDESGWWQPHRPSRSRPRSILITGARGAFAGEFARRCAQRGLSCIALDRRDLDAADAASVSRALDAHQPWAVINAAGYVRVDEAERDTATCWRDNVIAPDVLAHACALRGISFATISSDLVFDGALSRPYVESDAVSPLNAYGRSKVEAERRVLDAAAGAIVIRSAWFFSLWHDHNFLTAALRAAAAGERIALPDDQIITPTYLPHLADATLDLVLDGASGIWHLANSGEASVVDIARRAVSEAGFDPSLVCGRSTAALGAVAPRPRWSALGSERSSLMPSVDQGIRALLDELRPWEWPAPASSMPEHFADTQHSSELSQLPDLVGQQG